MVAIHNDGSESWPLLLDDDGGTSWDGEGRTRPLVVGNGGNRDGAVGGGNLNTSWFSSIHKSGHSSSFTWSVVASFWPSPPTDEGDCDDRLVILELISRLLWWSSSRLVLPPLISCSNPSGTCRSPGLLKSREDVLSGLPMLVAQPLSSSSSWSDGERLFTSKSMAESSPSLGISSSISPMNMLDMSLDIIVFGLVLRDWSEGLRVCPSPSLSNTAEVCTKLTEQGSGLVSAHAQSAMMVTWLSHDSNSSTASVGDETSMTVVLELELSWASCLNSNTFCNEVQTLFREVWESNEEDGSMADSEGKPLSEHSGAGDWDLVVYGVTYADEFSDGMLLWKVESVIILMMSCLCHA